MNNKRTSKTKQRFIYHGGNTRMMSHLGNEPSLTFDNERLPLRLVCTAVWFQRFVLDINLSSKCTETYIAILATTFEESFNCLLHPLLTRLVLVTIVRSTFLSRASALANSSSSLLSSRNHLDVCFRFLRRRLFAASLSLCFRRVAATGSNFKRRALL